eukprot:3690566-Amphidinium_carterae.7
MGYGHAQSYLDHRIFRHGGSASAHTKCCSCCWIWCRLSRLTNMAKRFVIYDTFGQPCWFITDQAGQPHEVGTFENSQSIGHRLQVATQH